MLPEAVIYMPFAELVDIDKEIERLQKEEQRLTKELARVNGMLSNERFMSKAPESKVAEERAKLEKYSQMMDQVKEKTDSSSGKIGNRDASGILTVKKWFCTLCGTTLQHQAKQDTGREMLMSLQLIYGPSGSGKSYTLYKKNHRAVHTGAGPGVYRDRSGAVYHADTAGTRRTASKQGNFKY